MSFYDISPGPLMIAEAAIPSAAAAKGRFLGREEPGPMPMVAKFAIAS